MSEIQAPPGEGFTAYGDGRFRGDDGHGGELAGMALYVVRALVQVDQLLGSVGSARCTRGAVAASSPPRSATRATSASR